MEQKAQLSKRLFLHFQMGCSRTILQTDEMMKTWTTSGNHPRQLVPHDARALTPVTLAIILPREAPSNCATPKRPTAMSVITERLNKRWSYRTGRAAHQMSKWCSVQKWMFFPWMRKMRQHKGYLGGGVLCGQRRILIGDVGGLWGWHSPAHPPTQPSLGVDPELKNFLRIAQKKKRRTEGGMWYQVRIQIRNFSSQIMKQIASSLDNWFLFWW